jgi:hypothetical protein
MDLEMASRKVADGVECMSLDNFEESGCVVDYMVGKEYGKELRRVVVGVDGMKRRLRKWTVDGMAYEDTMSEENNMVVVVVEVVVEEEHLEALEVRTAVLHVSSDN